MSLSTLKVAIAGAGIGGLTTALALLQKGVDVTVYEQAPELSEVGAGIQLAANGTRILMALGLHDALKGKLVEAAGKEVRLWNAGDSWKLFDLGEDSRRRFGSPYWMVHRGDLHTALLEAVRVIKPDAVVTGWQVASVRQDENGVELTASDGRTATAGILVGADGVHSAVRMQLFGEGQATFTGLMAWRGLAPMDKLPAELRRLVGTNWIGPGGHCITYPLRGGTVLNFVGLIEQPEWKRESWSEAGTIAECDADFKNWHPLIHRIIAAIDVPYRWALLQREPIARWTEGRITLLGDACHPTLPFLAQGAIMAIEDAVILARCIETYGRDYATAFNRYEALRKDRTSAVVSGSKDNTARFHNPQLANYDTAVSYINREWAPEKVRQRYDWLFEYDALAVAV